MAEEATAPVAVDATKTTEVPSRPAASADSAAAVDAKPATDGDVEPAEAPVEEQTPEAATATSEVADSQEASAPAENGETATEASATSNGVSASAKKANHGRRKSSSGVPEHKSKKTPSKKKKPQPEMHLDTKPGDMWMVAMRGYQPWPVIICDEAMLPETLLAKRPVSAVRVDGTYREDYLEGGKNAKDRRYPVMFLGTNEFAWQVNTDLLPFDLDSVKTEVESGTASKKNKRLSTAYEEAAQGHDLEYFKEMLSLHDEAMAADQETKKAKAEEKATKKEKATKRKSAAAVESEDVDMEDAEDAPATGKKKGTKRKKGDENESGPDKPAKTPKAKLKLNNKPPKDASAAKPKKEPKSKKAKVSDDEETDPDLRQVAEEKRVEQLRLARAKSVLYLRHRLQKGFLSRDQAPQDEDMPSMSDHLKQLEDLTDLEAEIIKQTKVHKVLKAIIKLNAIPREDEFNFKTRSNNLLTKWTGMLSEPEAPAEPSTTTAPTTNGVSHDGEKKTDDATSAKSEEPTASAEAKPADTDGDVPMVEAKDEVPAAKADEALAPTAETATA
ncbi:hypothetical protein P280DRAFT_145428 [Massarina eburnea CBS 473.64]|uniref:PWWP domain-containing protein n=1 Tax=Massarina eburnea CBS 473.64 TaxID=1395130 RepID=A0A6A6RMS6_9PLEO|nr:hypothetical protein P280DRAFT_145428 [Massarina eburnea CBS 473.64]